MSVDGESPGLATLVEWIRALSPTELAEKMPFSGLDRVLGLRVISASPTRVEAVFTASEQHLQPYGLVHGGVYCAVIESVCSVGAALNVVPMGRHAVGVENHTRFRKAARAGLVLRVVAEPVSVDGDHHRWAARVLDGDRLIADGEVVLRCLPVGAALAGESFALARDVLPRG
jgi:1,4-dihydroxy-2-naphthoyl-CoA hydrolase